MQIKNKTENNIYKGIAFYRSLYVMMNQTEQLAIKHKLLNRLGLIIYSVQIIFLIKYLSISYCKNITAHKKRLISKLNNIPVGDQNLYPNYLCSLHNLNVSDVNVIILNCNIPCMIIGHNLYNNYPDVLMTMLYPLQ